MSGRAAPKATNAKHAATSSRHVASAKKRASHAHSPKKARSSAIFPGDVENTAAYRYAQLGSDACYEELEKRELSVRRESEQWPGLSAPVRLTGPLNGVTFRTDIDESERDKSPYELFDCRLVLALHDFTLLLRAQGIHEVVMSSAYRPPPKSADPDAQGKRHAGGLAIDMHRFRHDDGRWFKIDRDFHGRMGASVCGKAASLPQSATEEARLLRRLVCGAAEQRLFQIILTPNYDAAHRNHLHFGLTMGVRWFIVS